MCGDFYLCTYKTLIFLFLRSMFTSGLTESTQKEVRIIGVEAESMDLVLNYAYTSSYSDRGQSSSSVHYS